MPKENVKPATFTEALRNPDRAQALEDAFKVAMDKSNRAIAWYDTSLTAKRWGAALLRIGTIILGGLATITPVALSMIPDGYPTLVKSLLPLSAVFGGAAASLVLIDKYFGFSSGWVRYITTYLDLQAQQELFEFEWAKQRIGLTPPISEDRYRVALDVLTSFLRALNAALARETEAWATEFRGAITELDAATRAMRADAERQGVEARGGLEVKVQGVERLEGQAFIVTIDDGTPLERSGTPTTALTDLRPGVRKVAVRGKIGSAEVSDEQVVTIEPGKITRVNMVFPGA